MSFENFVHESFFRLPKLGAKSPPMGSGPLLGVSEIPSCMGLFRGGFWLNLPQDETVPVIKA